MKTQITRALISVSNKDGIVELAKTLKNKFNIEIISTGGTATLLKENSIEIKEAADVTGFPEIMDGRVKTLHPKIHGGILAKRDVNSHVKAMEKHDIDSIDLVIINLYPFLKTLEKTDDINTIIENIDVGGPAMVRAAAKNHDYVTVITNPNDYSELIDELEENDGSTSQNFRNKCAANAFAHTASYDTLISNWFYKQQNITLPEVMNITAIKKQNLRYGENSHQKAAFYKYFIPKNKNSISNAKQIQGKELSYNNINDANAALDLALEFTEPSVAIIKHANPCGVASADNINDAYKRAFAADNISAFGGIVALNKEVDENLAKTMLDVFYEVIIAPAFSNAAKEVFATKRNLRLLEVGSIDNTSVEQNVYCSITDGMLIQTKDITSPNSQDLKFVTKTSANNQQIADLIFAMKVCKHVKSNAIVLAKDNTTIGIGAGQMSRIDSVKNACQKAVDMQKSTSGAVLASDAFFPFADSIEFIADKDIAAIIQPGGSIKDSDVIQAANDKNIAMAFTGIRHFKH